MGGNSFFTAVFLCVSVITCEAWILNRRNSPDCLTRDAPCLQNGWIITELFVGRGFEGLVVDNRFALQCSPQVRNNTESCIANNLDCTRNYLVDRLVPAYEYMCDNEKGFIRAASCWNSDSLGSTVVECQSSSKLSNFCSIPDCLEREIAKMSGCTRGSSVLFSDIARTALQAGGVSCSFQNTE